MPPVRFKPPLPVRIKSPKMRISPLFYPDIRLGKTLIAASPQRVTAEQLEASRKLLRKKLGKGREFLMNVHATYPVTKKAEATKQGGGKGSIEKFVARVPAGRVLFHIPALNPFFSLLPMSSNYDVFKGILGSLPMACVCRTQSNAFAEENLLEMTKRKLEDDAQKKLKVIQGILKN